VLTSPTKGLASEHETKPNEAELFRRILPNHLVSCGKRMKKFVKVFAVVAVSYLLCFWTCYVLLVASWAHITLWQFLGFEPAPSTSHFAVFVRWAFIVLAVPSSILLDGISSAYLMPAVILCSVLNSVVWGACLALPIYGVRRRFRHPTD
jgi:uncharacterized membrane protein YagU involved in acid resistance